MVLMLYILTDNLKNYIFINVYSIVSFLECPMTVLPPVLTWCRRRRCPCQTCMWG